MRICMTLTLLLIISSMTGADMNFFINTIRKRPSIPTIYENNQCVKKSESIYDRCHSSKNYCNSTVCCLGLKIQNKNHEKCLHDKDCEYLVHYEYEGPLNTTHKNKTYTVSNKNQTVKIKYHIFSRRTTPHYVAYGISTNDKMGNDLVFVCELKNNKSVSFYLTWNIQKHNVLPQWDLDKIASEIKTEFNETTNFTHCAFTLHPVLHYIHSKPFWNFSILKDNHRHDKYYDLLAAGTVDSNGELKDHKHVFITGHVNNRWSYTNQCIVTAGYSDYAAEKYHASYMIVNWMVVIPLNGFISRFFKATCSHRVAIFGPLWFVSHKIVSMMSILMVIGGYVIVTAERDYAIANYYPAITHSFLGFTTIAFYMIEAGLGACRIRFYSESTTLKIKRSHALLTFWVQLLGYVTIILSPYYTYNVLPCAIYSVIYPYVTVQLGFYILMTFYYRKVDVEFGQNSNRAILEYPLYPTRYEIIFRPETTLRGIIFLCYVAASLGFSSLAVCEMLFPDAFGLPCYPRYHHIPRNLRPSIAT